MRSTITELREKWSDVHDTSDSDDYLTKNLVGEFLEDLEWLEGMRCPCKIAD